ncbi:hypothetical protein D3C80_1674550 [compost metagenome]
MFWRNFQVAADVMGRQLLDIAWIFYRDVITYTGGDQDLLDALQIAGAAIQIDRRLVVGVHMLANARINT